MEHIGKFRLQAERHQRQTECKAVILKHDNRTVVVFGSIPKRKKKIMMNLGTLSFLYIIIQFRCSSVESA